MNPYEHSNENESEDNLNYLVLSLPLPECEPVWYTAKQMILMFGTDRWNRILSGTDPAFVIIGVTEQKIDEDKNVGQ